MVDHTRLDSFDTSRPRWESVRTHVCSLCARTRRRQRRPLPDRPWPYSGW